MLKENCFIVKLDISENTVGAIGAGAISSMLEINYTLKTLILRSTHLKDSDAQLLSSALKNNSTLLELDLCHNDLGDLAGMYLASGLAENNSLAKLNLSWNAIRGKGSVALFNALKANSILEILDLSWNGISLPGCQALGRALKVNTTLRILDMSNNHITPEAAKKLVIGLKKNIGLEAFLVGMNPLGEEGIMTLLVPLYKHSTLRIFSLQGLTVSTGIQAKIEDLMDIKDLYILHSGVGGYRRQRISCSTISMVEQFINENQLHALDGFTQRDLDRTGYISFGDVLEVLYELGLKISEEQVKKIQTHVMLQRRSKVNYRQVKDYIFSPLSDAV
uniref:Leucine-rich repeat-containing protein LOC400891 homolog n=1 Tax=Saccoglossus kowalevskii TaxID=10224 RepID=A0ABM0MMI2_SACKO|nr:PREDICTED: leucine-rich repeat-containing protein LOC400891 homolog [Saccoglossus kowalevskii]